MLTNYRCDSDPCVSVQGTYHTQFALKHLYYAAQNWSQQQRTD